MTDIDFLTEYGTTVFTESTLLKYSEKIAQLFDYRGIAV